MDATAPRAAGTPTPPAAGTVPPRPSVAAELQRAERRRRELGLRQAAGNAGRPWALCLSGGGIRSATFCLGVLQGLSRLPCAEALKALPQDQPFQPDGTNHLLAQFDFLSTVSGGGYIGSFFSSLFVPGRLSGQPAERYEIAARRAYQVLQEDPPQRMYTTTTYDPKRPGAAALAWLRDNGRYLTPTGGGDMGYAAAIAVRNWFSVHFVVATVLLCVLSASLFLRLAAAHCPGWVALETQFDRSSDLFAWSSTWYAVAAVVLGLALPFGVAYWFAHPGKGKDLEGPSRPFTAAWAGGLALAGFCLGLGGWGAWQAERAPAWAVAFLVVGGATLAGCVFHTLTHGLGRPKNVSAQRVLLSRWLTRCLTAACALSALALVETLALTVVHVLDDPGARIAAGLSTGSITAAVVWAIRAVASHLQADRPRRQRKVKLPLEALAALLAAVLWSVVATALGALLLWLYFDGQSHLYALFSDRYGTAALYRAGFGSLILLFIAVMAGLFPGFVNMSTYQPLYSARLTRAYLGASNHARFSGESARLHNVAEPAQGDTLRAADLYKNPLAPVHFINVCLNQTAGPEGQLVQRDRKGKPLATSVNGFYLDGEPYAIKETSRPGDLGAHLTVGEWVGVSGAAVSTGLGRSTSLGTSLLLGFANVRLGRWWPHGIEPARGQPSSGGTRRFLASQRYLLDEMTAKFQGSRLRYGYLSDGGHFENTAAYEMLRPERRVELLVVCDCGADPEYLFGDLANLVRLARIDHQLELRVNTRVLEDPLLNPHFAHPEAFRRDAEGTLPAPGPCAVLLDVFGCPDRVGGGQATETLLARIVLLKPTLVAGAAADVSNYAANHDAFPQEPTGDQFFDEAQWESYRKLGLQIAMRLFPQRHDDYAEAFWAALALA